MKGNTKEGRNMTGITNGELGGIVTNARPPFLKVGVLHSMGASNVNRGEDGSPKSIMFGGTQRGRWSGPSQMYCLEKLLRHDPRFAEIREYFASDLTMKIKEILEAKLIALGVDPKQSKEWAEEFDFEVFRQASKAKKNPAKDQGKKSKKEISEKVIKVLATEIFEAKGGFGSKELTVKVPKHGAFTEKSLADLTEAVVACGAERGEAEEMVAAFHDSIVEEPASKMALFRISQSELDWVADKIRETKSGSFGCKASKAAEMLNARLDEKHSDGLLNELVGRMNACTAYQQDSKMYVAHAIGTAPMETEEEFITGIDRCTNDRNAAFMGNKELYSSVMYQCFIIDMVGLFNGYSLSDDIKRKIISMLVRAILSAIPQGGHAKMFSETEASYAIAMSWEANPRTLVNAFHENDDPRMSAAIAAIKQYAKDMVVSYADDGGVKIIAEYAFGKGSTVDFANEVANVYI